MALQRRSQLHLQGHRGTDLVGADGVPCVAAEPGRRRPGAALRLVAAGG